MASYNNVNNIQNDMNFNYTNSAVENKGLFSRILRGISSYGMNFNEMVARNQVGISITEDPFAARGDSLYSFFSSKAVASVLNKKSIPYLDRSYADKKRILREYSIKDEIRDFVTSIADECILYNDERDFCFPRAISNGYSQEIQDKYLEYFEKIYSKYGFSDGITAWTMLKDFLIDGYIAIEIIYDDKKKNIIGFARLSPDTLVPAFEPSIGHLWIQFPEDPQLRRIFLDSQIVYVSYSSQNEFSETSYVEGLIKPYNQLKILEQTRIMFNIINATVYQKFTIPVNGLSKQKAEEQIGQLIHDYSEEVEWDDSTGTLNINGSKHLPYNKQIWFPQSDAGTPAMELVSPEGHNLNESDMLTWFYNALKRASKIPFQRFDKENGGGNLINDSSDMTRDEIKFYNFINRLRANFKELITKPLKLQMLIEFPELKDDEIIMNQMDISFNTNQVFEEWKKLNNLSKKAEIFTTLAGVMDGEKPYFHIEYLIDNVFKLTPEEKAQNQKYWTKYANNFASVEDIEGDSGLESGNSESSFDMPSETSGVEDTTSQSQPEAGGDAEDVGTEFEF